MALVRAPQQPTTAPPMAEPRRPRGGPTLLSTTQAPQPLVAQMAGPPAVRMPVTTPPQRLATEVAPAPVPAQPRAAVEAERQESIGERFLWSLVEQFAPNVAPILRHGIVGWLIGQITDALSALVNSLAAPMLSLLGIEGTLTSHFAALIEWSIDAAAKLARGDCSSVAEAADKIGLVLDGIGSAIVRKWQDLSAKVRDLTTRLWEATGAPIWDLLKRIGGAVWEKIQAFGAWLWEETAEFRAEATRLATNGWTWLKNKLGIGEGEEGQNGLLQAVERLAREAWQWLKPRIEPIKKPLLVVGGVMLLLSPAGPIVAAGAGIYGLIAGIRWIRQHLQSPEGIVSQRGVLERTIIPGILRGVRSVTAALINAAAFVSAKLGQALSGLGELVTAVGASILQFATRIIQWISDHFGKLAQWADEKLTTFANWINTTLDRLAAYFAPLLNFLREVGHAIIDIYLLPVVVLGEVWKKIPDCIKEPVKNFLINQVLKRIRLFKQISELPALWTKIKATVLEIINKVFREGDLKGAALIVLKLVLNALNVPLELITGIFSKTALALDLILNDPIGFLGNLLLSMWQGFKQFLGAIGVHLLHGALDWLFGAVRDAGLHPPTSLTFSAIFTFVLEVLGITEEHVFELLADKIGQPLADKLHRAFNVLKGVWEWVTVLVEEGPQGLWTKLVERLDDLWTALLNGVVDWLIGNVTREAGKRIMAMLAGGPLGAILNGLISIYRAVRSFVRYFKQMLQVVDSVLDGLLDLAQGTIGPAAMLFESALTRVIPVIIGFLANQIGIGDLSDRIGNIVEVIREKVDRAIEWLIDQAINLGRAVLNALGLGEEPDTRTDEEKEADLNAAIDEVDDLLSPGDLLIEDVKERLPAIQTRYRLNSLKVVVDSEEETRETVHAEASINPEKKGPQFSIAGLLPDLKAIWSGLPKAAAKARRYFRDQVEEVGQEPALALFQNQIAQTSATHTHLFELRMARNLGPNIGRSPTVAYLVATQLDLGTLSFDGSSGSSDVFVSSNLLIAATSRKHAEGRAMARLARALDEVRQQNVGFRLEGGSAIVYVDKPVCGFCAGAFTSILTQYGIEITPVAPDRDDFSGEEED
jgi:hypothetical protein